ncbi:MAG: chloramphenicol acetyltransferase [Cyclobacteriaceae bacterium]|nr:chloramphenicol acetyltransferase [Cyclobacteriaceae bacterium]MCH8517276.1 chloramphenicol acetyltransferase [Cyclobacteriaceae bacterium]
MNLHQKEELNIEEWNRKQHFNFFKDFDEPFFGFTSEVILQSALKSYKEQGVSFFIYYLHKTLKVVNAIEGFRLRLIEGRVYLYDQIHASATIGREDGTFGYSFIPYHSDLQKFNEGALAEIDRVVNSKSLFPEVKAENVIHFSSLPWFDFSSVSHARNYKVEDSCPKISVGKVMRKESLSYFNISIHAHHALVDGADIGKFFVGLENEL